MGAERSTRHGLFEAPGSPEGIPELRIDPSWSPARLSYVILRNAWPWLLGGSALLILSNAATALLPAFIGGFIDAVVAPLANGSEVGGASVAAGRWVAGFVGIYLVMHVGYRFGGRMGWYGVQRSQYQLSQAVLGRILDRRGFEGPERAPGTLLTIASADVQRTCRVLYVAVYPPGEVVGLFMATAVLFLIHPILGLTAVLGLPLIMWLMNRSARPLHRRARAEQERLADATAVAADIVEGYRVLRGLHAHGTAARRYRAVSREALRGTLAVRRAEAAFDGLAAAMSHLFVLLIVAGAAALALNGKISVGQLVTTAGIAIALVDMIESLAGVLASTWAMSQASAARVLELVSAPANPARLGGQRPAHASDLRFEAVALPDGGILDGVVRSGELLRLDVTQSAQHHLAQLLRAEQIPDRGAITIGGVPVHEHAPEALRNMVLVLPHAPAIFDGTVLENVRMTGSDARRAECALETAGLAARELPEGYATHVTDGGRELSGGQRQRIALARGIAADPEVLVLIEATSSVDSVTEQRIAENIRAHRAGQTTIVMTSSRSFLADATVRSEPPSGSCIAAVMGAGDAADA